ncbi:tyrosinase family protein [Nitrosomonas supralitoralis]|uniref:Tyrosinase/peptidase n=1 Tax=Nitrosomonas supralitoralis TaxID=2116706 RepID=A0A2P7NYA8_9PROT|nr:tyrosinase family protein [Nitrosomonas supralitoralis]PSJ18429.1 tyrosinase/peptidase [Nitrosomonas supralitoralis]
MAIRKDANTLTAAEHTEFVTAIQALKTEGIYDQFVLRHANAIMSAIHRCPAFLPWHRRFIFDLELELQRVSGNSNLGIPYWNWPSGGANASMWNDDLLGGNGDASGVVRNGPFRTGQWTIVNSSGLPAGPLMRAFGQNGLPTLPTQTEIDQVMAVTPYDMPSWNINSNPSFRNQVEGWIGPNLHNRGHVWVGVSMLPMTSPNDPVFFMHHCMVDKIWHEWQIRFPNQGYLPANGGPFGQNLTDPMNNTPSGPIGSRPIDVLNSIALGIEYDDTVIQPQPPIPLIVVGANPTQADIGTAGETDVFRFEIPSFGPYTIYTTGPSDTFMTLFGPNDPNIEVASDDDAGENFNSQITRNLSAGTYYLRIRLYSSSATGNYAVAVRSDDAGPGPTPIPIPELVVDGASISAAISAANESDVYRFNIITSDTYTIQTNGPTDTFMSLHGPNSQIPEIASNDDAGVSFNALIRRQLAPGEYFVRVRHYSPIGTGPYTIRITRG